MRRSPLEITPGMELSFVFALIGYWAFGRLGCLVGMFCGPLVVWGIKKLS